VIPLVKAMITDDDRSYIRERVADGLLDDETEVGRFEQAFAVRVRAGGAVAVNSGTSALQLALAALEVGHGAEVLMPSYTCVALLDAINECGATAVLVDNEFDVERGRFHVDEADLHRKLTPRARAIVVSHMFGTLAELHRWDVGIPVIEDVTLSLGAHVHGRPGGSLSTVSVCSFHHSKMISTGRGGIVAASDDRMLTRLRELADYDRPVPGWRDRPLRELRGSFQPAFSFAMSSMQAALGISQLRQLDRFIDRRLALATKYTDHFREAGFVCPDPSTDRTNVFYRYMLDVGGEVPEVVRALRDNEIEVGRGVYPPVHALLGLPDDDFPVTRRCVDRLISVPVHPSVTDEQADYICDQVSAVAGG
jgi:dTDP-4-amino-4,6-dideoxygalactose transaminase